jgi:hypothetical protein
LRAVRRTWLQEEKMSTEQEQPLAGLSEEQLVGLLEDAAKNWLAHDGLWFQAAERRYGLQAAIELDAEAWAQFSAVEAQRIMRRLGIVPGGGLRALERALQFRLYAHINEQRSFWPNPHTLRFEMTACRVQEARLRKGLPDFPCKEVGIVEYTEFARAIDSRIKTRCVQCPPDPRLETAWCIWEFSIPEGLSGVEAGPAEGGSAGR